MNIRFYKNIMIIIGVMVICFFVFLTLQTEPVTAGSYDGEDLALAILANQSSLISSSYEDKDRIGVRQQIVLSSKGTMVPQNGSTFAFLSTGIAGTDIVTTDENNPGNERGIWFKNRYGHPRDRATLTMTLQVPPYMHYLYYDFQFFSAEYPEYVGTQYNDKFKVIVNSPSMGMSTYVCDVNSGNFVLDSNYISGTGFDIFAQSGNPGDVDYVDTTPRNPGADAGATALITRGGESHPVSPNEQITVQFIIRDVGDNQFDSGVFIDNLVFSGYAKTEITAKKEVEDLNGGDYECNDTMEYTVTISNTGDADQNDNAGNEFEDFIPENTTYVTDSATATSGVISHDDVENKITWTGEILKESSVVIRFQVKINASLQNGTIISNQGTAYWDSNEDGTNDETELTDLPLYDDGVDSDGDGETYDDDPTNITVIVFEPPSSLFEGFSDDTTGEKATQSYYGHLWFETTTDRCVGSNFEVASSYYYSSSKSFKTKLRDSGSPQYWNYTTTDLDGDIEWWEIWFTCGNVTESYDLFLNFTDGSGNAVAKIKFEYTHEGTSPPTEWVAKMYYWDGGWSQLYSDYIGGYLYNNWYKIRIEKQDGTNLIDYTLNKTGVGTVDSETGGQLSQPFTSLTQIEWSTSENPVVCPMFFWDEHRIGLT